MPRWRALSSAGPGSPPEQKPRFFYGWIILGIGFLTVVGGYICRNTFSVFYPAIVDEFGWGRGNTALIFSINVLIYGLFAPFAGGLVDRFRPRYVLAVGAIVMGVGVALCGLASQQWQFYLLYGVVASIGLSVAGWTPVVALVGNWFVRRRALSMGILGAGFGSSLVFALAAQYLISNFGWRTAYAFIGILAAATIAPLAVLFVRRSPKEKGTFPDGVSAQEAAVREALHEADTARTSWDRTEWTLRRAARTRQFWLLFALAFTIMGIVEQIAIAHQVYFYRDAGYSALSAAGFYSAFGVAFIIGNLAGSVSDRVGRERMFVPACLICAASALLLFLLDAAARPWLASLFAVVFGLTLGSGPCVYYATVADLFHGPNYGRIVGMMVLGFSLGGTLSPWLAGHLNDATGNYESIFWLLFASMVASALMMRLVAPSKLSPVARHG
ncbi:MAG: MFS transporter [Dehalococcoidia bacterium]|nr:MFS transporter [Dehalococcoidia bacterium]